MYKNVLKLDCIFYDFFFIALQLPNCNKCQNVQKVPKNRFGLKKIYMKNNFIYCFIIA